MTDLLALIVGILSLVLQYHQYEQMKKGHDAEENEGED